MALIIPVGFAHAVYEFSLTGDPEPIVTTMGHDLSAVSGGDYTDAANDLMFAFAVAWAARLSNVYTLTGVSLYVGQDGGPPAVYESTDAAVPMTQSGPALPQNCAFLMRKRTSRAGRRGRGRCYIPGVNEESVGHTGIISPSSLTNYQASADMWYDELVNPGAGAVAMPPVILHRSEGISTPGTPTPILSFLLDDQIATQRQRMRK